MMSTLNVMEQKRGVYAIPVGYVFRPEPEELLWFLVESIQLQDRWVRPPEIRNIDLYDKGSNPGTLFDGSSEKPCYVMTRLEKKVSGKSRFKRTAGAGTWKEQKSSDVTLRLEDGVELKGLKRYFCFVPNDQEDSSYKEHGRWIMNEYSLLQDGFDDYVICEIHKKPSSKRKHDRDDTVLLQNQVVIKKMRSTPLSDDHVGVVRVEAANEDDDDEYFKELVDLLVVDDIVPTSTPGHDQEVLMTKTQSSTNTCEDDDDDRELIELIESNVEEETNDIVACDSLAPAPVAVSDHDRQGMISDDHGRGSIVNTDSRVPTKQSYPLPFDFPDDFWDFPVADRPAHMQESTTSTCGHHDDYLGSLIVDGPDDPMPWEGLGFNSWVCEA